MHKPCTSSLFLARTENQDPGVEGPRSFYQPKDVTGQENRIIKPQVHRPSKGVALILSSLLTPRSCLTTHTAKGIPSVTAQFEKLARWPFQELLR